jgi:hypothetical protein
MREVSRLRGSGVFEAPFHSEETSEGGDQLSAPADDRGHDGPQSVACDAAILRACGCEVQPVFRPVAGPAGPGGRPGVPGASRRERDIVAGAEPDGVFEAVPV